nr:PREDICTED: GON-4-like protein [Latimeria chalumnae]|eukprot:XP_014350813.1 PREDICTED: GON-4-like protein [Latimeria chalumnae]
MVYVTDEDTTSLDSSLSASETQNRPSEAGDAFVMGSSQSASSRSVTDISQQDEGNHQTEDRESQLFIPLEAAELEEGRKKKKKQLKRKREREGQEDQGGSGPGRCELQLDDDLDRNLDDRAKQHNLTVVNVRNILHEVITNEHVVAMMKAAISETQDMPMFGRKNNDFSVRNCYASFF